MPEFGGGVWVSFTYNKLGQVTSETRHAIVNGITYTTQHRYNANGWLTHTENPDGSTIDI